MNPSSLNPSGQSVSSFYYSIVVTSRNDDHGGDMLKRMTLFVNGLLHQTRKFQLPVELIFVEWNPPADRPFLSEILPGPKSDDYLTIKYIRVPREVHERSERSDTIVIPQFTAKNVGIRRANGDYVLATNVDLLFSDPLMEILSNKDLEPAKFYRANRVDVDNKLSTEWAFEKQIAYCRKNVLRVLGWNARYKHINLREYGLDRSNFILKSIYNIGFSVFSKKANDAYIRFYKLDKFACGDFTLMSKEAWLRIGGHAELEVFPAHVDTLALVAASAAGMEQVTFKPDACIYHLEHDNGWVNTAPMKKLRSFESNPSLGYEIVHAIALELFENNIQFDFNNDYWGFRDEDFEEVVFSTKAIDAK